MKNHQMIQNISSGLFLIFVSILFIRGYDYPGDEAVNKSSSVAPVEASVNIDDGKEEPAVIYKSNDLGASWTPFAEGIPKAATLSGIKQYGDIIYVTTDYHGVFVISNNDDTWTPLKIESFENLDINCIEVDSNNIALGTLEQGILISTDGGRTWQQAAQNIKSSIRAFIKSGNRLYAGTDAGIYTSTDMENTWSLAFGSMQILGFTSLNGKIYAATQHGALMCEGRSEKWVSIYEGDALHDIAHDGTYIYAMTIGQQLLKTRNDGLFWENAQNGIPWPVNFYTNEIQHIGRYVFSAQWIGIYHSTDNGNSWRILEGLPDSTAFSTLEVTDIGILAGVSIR